MSNATAAITQRASEPQIRIFPHSREEFPSDDLLRIWLLNALRGRGGRYRLRSLKGGKPQALPPGSIVLFRYADDIIGEAVVQKDIEKESGTERNLWTGKDVEYEALVTFAPSSIRLYAPAVSVQKIQKYVGKDITTAANAYVELDWNAYASVLQDVVSAGAFIS
jgi:hypothetical protein